MLRAHRHCCLGITFWCLLLASSDAQIIDVSFRPEIRSLDLTAAGTIDWVQLTLPPQTTIQKGQVRRIDYRQTDRP